MDNSQGEFSRSSTKSEESTALAQDVTSRLLTIECMLRNLEVEFNDYKIAIDKSMQNCYRVDRCVLYYNVYCERSLSAVCKIETDLAIARWNLVRMENIISSIDRRRPSAKREQKRQSLVVKIAGTQTKIEDLVETLLSEKTKMVVSGAKLKSIIESVNADKSCIFTITEEFQRIRQRIIAERNKLLASKNASADED